MKLHIKKDGTLYMKRPVPGIGWTTWQVTQEGVDLLARKRVNIGDEIPEKVFDELLRKNYLYTGGSGPGDEVEFASTKRSGWGSWAAGAGKRGRGRSSATESKKDGTEQGESTAEGCLGLLLLVFIIWVVVKIVG